MLTLALSPMHAVTQRGLAIGEAVAFLAAAGAWVARGRPQPPLHGARAAARALVRDPPALLFAAVVACALAYELALGLTVPPNNWDSLTYHLARAASWFQHGEIDWVANAPSDRLNEYQPLAEQQVLYLFAVSAGSRLYALPQFSAELAILAAVYGTSRRLGFGVRAAVGAACLFATFSLVALEATTAQNDLVAASMPVAAAFLMLGDTRREALIAGGALGLGLGAKLTTLLVWPALALLAAARGRSTAVRAVAGAALAFVAVGMWGYVLNIVHTGHVLGYGVSRTQHTRSPSLSNGVDVGVHLVYRFLDLSAVSHRLSLVMAVGGGVAGVAAARFVYRRGWRRALVTGAAVGLPFLAPMIVRGVGALFSYRGGINDRANEDYGAFGPLGALLLIATAVWVPIVYARGRTDLRQLALALALPTFVVLLAVQSEYNDFLTRFVLVAAALTTPLLARYFRTTAATSALALAGSVILFVTLRSDVAKQYVLHPWRFDQAKALSQTWQPQTEQALRAYDRIVPSHACVGAIVGGDEPSYVLWGPNLDRRVYYLPSIGALPQAYRDGVFDVVISAAANAPSAEEFRAVGWRIRPLGTYWLLASAPRRGGDCA